MASDAEDMPPAAAAAAAANYWSTDTAAADLLRSIGAVAPEAAEAGDDNGPTADDDDEEEGSRARAGRKRKASASPPARGRGTSRRSQSTSTASRRSARSSDGATTGTARGRSSSVGTTNGTASSASTRSASSAAGGGAIAASTDGSAASRSSRRGTSATTSSEDTVADQCAECDAWRHVTRERANYMWICHDIGKVCDCTNDNGIVDDNLDHDKDALEYGSEGGSEEDGSDAEESDDEDDDVTWKSDFYCADFSKDTLTKHVPVVQHGDSSLLKFGPSRPKPGQRGPVKHYLCNAVDCGKNANYGPDPLCVSHQREKVEGRTCTGQFRPNKSWSPVKSLLLASEEKCE